MIRARGEKVFAENNRVEQLDVEAAVSRGLQDIHDGGHKTKAGTSGDDKEVIGNERRQSAYETPA